MVTWHAQTPSEANAHFKTLLIYNIYVNPFSSQIYKLDWQVHIFTGASSSSLSLPHSLSLSLSLSIIYIYKTLTYPWNKRPLLTPNGTGQNAEQQQKHFGNTAQSYILLESSDYNIWFNGQLYEAVWTELDPHSMKDACKHTYCNLNQLCTNALEWKYMSSGLHVHNNSTVDTHTPKCSEQIYLKLKINKYI